MSVHPSEIKLTDLVKQLERRQALHQNTILFLGSRTGGLFRSKLFYDMLERSSKRSFRHMSQVEQFAQCYRILNQEKFTTDDLHDIFTSSLEDQTSTDADLSLAELIKKGLFDVVISTNFDGILQHAFGQVNMSDPYDFHVFVPQQDLLEDIAYHENRSACTFLKVFGDFTMKEYSINRSDICFESHEGLKSFLISLLKQTVLMIGYDPLWDHAIDYIFPDEGQEFWYINEEKCVENAVFRALQNRKGKYIVGGEGSYAPFIRSLHWYMLKNHSKDYRVESNGFNNQADLLNETASRKQSQTAIDLLPALKQETIPPAEVSIIHKEQRKKVWIVYSQQDEKYREQLMVHFKPYEREVPMDFLSDLTSVTGTNWQADFQRSLDDLKVAILLVSAEFIASRFIAENILPPLLKIATAQQVRIIPVMIGHCAFANTAMAQFQAINNPNRPLNRKKKSERDKDWVTIVDSTISLIKEI